MTAPHNKLVTDGQIVSAIKSANNYREAADELGIAYQTLKNRVSMMRKAEPEQKRPNTYDHKAAQRYFVSSVMSDAPLDRKAYRAIKSLCGHINAQEVYIPVEYAWQDSHQRTSEPVYPKQVRDYLLSDDISLNSNIKVMGSYPLHATLQNPLTGLKGVSATQSAIFGHPQRAMESVATAKYKLPKLQYTTGCISEPRYTRSKAGRKARDNHVIGGLVIEIKDDEVFHVFEVTVNNGVLYHLNYRYDANGYEKYGSLPAIYMADEHAEFYPEEVKEATYTGRNSLVNSLMPDIVVRGDVLNHGSDSHHERNNVLSRIIRELSGSNDVQSEIELTLDHIKETTVGGYKNVIVASNHHDHLNRWLNEFNPHTGSAKNIWLYHQLNADVIQSVINGGISDAFALYCKKYREEVYADCVFLPRDEEYKVCGVNVDSHGDKGPNGSRGNAVNISQVYESAVIGHGHSSRIYKNVHQVGVCGQDFGYDVGPSGWMVSHCLIYPDGSKTLVHVANGEWRV